MTRIKFLLFIIFLVAADQLSKYIVRHSGGFYVCNSGIAFGWKIPEVLIWLVYAIIVIFACYYFFKKTCFKITNKSQNKNPSPKADQPLAEKYIIHNTYPVILVLSGAFSNLIDRFIFSCIIDFIDINHFIHILGIKFNYPLFNLADVFIVIGSGLLIWKIIKPKKI